MKNQLISIFYITFLVFAASVSASDTLRFKNPENEARYYGLIQELRCVVCQNQTLADSHAPLAVDLRKEVHRMVEQGDTNEVILQFLVQRYGEFVLYRPKIEPSTYFLWFGPALFLILAIIAFLRIARRSVPKDVVPLNSNESERLKAILTQRKAEN